MSKKSVRQDWLKNRSVLNDINHNKNSCKLQRKAVGFRDNRNLSFIVQFRPIHDFF